MILTVLRWSALVTAVPIIFSAVNALAADLAAPAKQVLAGDWRLTFETPLGEMPVRLNLIEENGDWSAFYVNGPERMAAEITTVSGNSLLIEFPSYNSSLAGSMISEDTMQGFVHFNRQNATITVPFKAIHGQTYRFFAENDLPKTNLTGRWAQTSTSIREHQTRSGLLELKHEGSVIVGTSMHTEGDSRFLTGTLKGNNLYLSTFDGGAGSLWRGTLAEDGKLVGKSYSIVSRTVTKWSAERDTNATLADASKLTYLKQGYDRIEFSFPDLNGNLVSLADEKYRNKVVVITIGGSWCATCHDESTFFSPFYKKNHQRGLEAIGLMYEYSPEFEKAVRACLNYKRRYDIQYSMLIAGTADKDAASKTLPMINAVLVYPTMIIVDRSGSVRHIHTGFPGPATGEHHEKFKRDFTRKINELLAEDV